MEIELTKVSVRLPLGGRELFRIPRLSIASGQKILIQGASGRGKTTLLHLIGGLLLPDEGEVRVGGVSLAQLNETARAQLRRDKMAMIFQRLNLIDHLTAEENVLLGNRLATSANARKVLEDVGLADRFTARSSVLSLGEQQRVATARALLARPDILLADEPTSSLDERNTEKVLDLLFEASTDRTLIVVSHDQRIAERFTKRLNFDDWVSK